MEQFVYIYKRAKWYIKLFFAFARISLLSQLEYRLNFIAGTCVELSYMCIKLIYLIVVMQTGINIGMLTPNMVMMFVGTYIFMTGIWMMFSGINSIPSKVLSGQLDMLMIKPGSLKFLQTFGSFDFAMTFPNVTVGIILICVSWHKVHIPLTFSTVSGFLFYIIMGIILTYAITLILALLVFWVTSTGGVWTLFAALWDFNNMPMTLYNRIAQQIGTFIIPVFVLTNWAGLFVLHQLSVLQMVWGIVMPIIMILISNLMWKRGMRKYTSANG
jgi:ABC-2 type transport system permease protein